MRKPLLILSLVAVTLFASASDVFAQRGGRRGGVSISVGSGYYGSPYYYGGRSYYGSPYYYGNRYYYSTPTYVYPETVVVPAPEVRQSAYLEPNVATITVLVPNANAQVWFDDALTAQRGLERTFHTPALQASGSYNIRASWTENGRTMNTQRAVQVQPGQSVTVDFRGARPENLPAPK